MILKSIALVLLLTMTCLAQETKPNFSGTWVCEYCAKGGERDRIEHKEPQFTISETVGRADIIYSITFKTDGTDQKSKAGEISRVAHWEGNTLVLERKWNDGGAVSTRREELLRSDDGKEMTKHVHTSGTIGISNNYFLTFKKVSDGIKGIQLGDSEATVRHEWGEPNSVEVEGDQTIFVYAREGPKDLIVIFINGKMTDSTWRKKVQ